MPVYRGYGYADDICMLAIKWLMSDNRAPSSAVDTVSHSLSLVELAKLISLQYNLPDPLSCVDPSQAENSYTSNSQYYLGLMQDMGISPTSMADQIADTYAGLALTNHPTHDYEIGALTGS
jgi:hypothetical protein